MALPRFLSSGPQTKPVKDQDAMDMMDRSGRVLTCLAVSGLVTSLLLIFVAPLGYTPVMMEAAYCGNSRSAFNLSLLLPTPRSAIETDWDVDDEPASLSPSPVMQPAIPLPAPDSAPMSAPPGTPNPAHTSDSESAEPGESAPSPTQKGQNSSEHSGWPVHSWGNKHEGRNGAQSLSPGTNSATTGYGDDGGSSSGAQLPSATMRESKVQSVLKCEIGDTKCITCAAVQTRLVLLKALGAVSLMLCVGAVATALAASMAILCRCCRRGYQHGTRACYLGIASALLGIATFITDVAIILTLVNVIITTAATSVPPQISRLLIASFAPAAVILAVHVVTLTSLAYWIQHMVQEPPPNAPAGPVMTDVHAV